MQPHEIVTIVQVTLVIKGSLWGHPVPTRNPWTTLFWVAAALSALKKETPYRPRIPYICVTYGEGPRVQCKV
jgi:hypothetical protein